LRVVLDTNVLVSALQYPGGPPESLYRLVVERRLELVSSEPLLSELRRVLIDKFDWDSNRVNSTLRQLARLGVIVDPTEEVADIAADPDDNRVLEAAATGTVDFVVSGDRHLLALGSWRGIPIVSPAVFLAEWK
jgi:uncharacterized protein